MQPDPVRHHMRLLRELGFSVLESIEIPEPASAPTPAASVEAPAPVAFDGPPLALEERVERLRQISAAIAECHTCRLCHSRTNTVPGEGDPMAELMFIGEGPGATEDQMGRPFVGKAGELLTKIIQAMQFRREDVFIANIVKCRPPGNRQPEFDEMETCLPFIEEQISILRPRVIVTLGKTALMGLMPTYRRAAITKVRGEWLEYNGIPVMPTFHPAYLLRSPQQKRLVWEDMQEVMKVFGKTVG